MATKTKTKKTNETKSTKKVVKKSITSEIYALFIKNGIDEVKLDAAVEVARKIKKDTRFDSSHLAFHKNKFREKVRLGLITLPSK